MSPSFVSCRSIFTPAWPAVPHPCWSLLASSPRHAEVTFNRRRPLLLLLLRSDGALREEARPAHGWATMNNHSTDVSPDFVLMRLLSGAEDDRMEGQQQDGEPEERAQGVGDNPTGTGSPAGPTQDFPYRGASQPQLMVFRKLLSCGNDRSEYQGPHLTAPDGPPPSFNAASGASEGASWDLLPSLALPRAHADAQAEGKLCSRHRLVTSQLHWPPLPDKALSLGFGGAPDDPVFSLAGKLGTLGVEPPPPLPPPPTPPKDGETATCRCESIFSPVSRTMGPGDDPTETSDALLVLEGLGAEEVSGLGMGACPHTAEQVEEGAQAHVAQPQLQTVRACSSSSSLLPAAGAREEKTLRASAKSRKGSLKIRLSKLFRSKHCSIPGHMLDKRPSVASSASSTDSVLDATSGGDPDTSSHSRLTRTQSAFSPVSFSPVFTGETVSLVDIDISRRGVNSPNPPTPPPPPRRSLSLLDTFLEALPRSVPLQAEPPPASRVAPAPLLCRMRRPDSSNFAASLRELEKCGWYWGPMNWEDAEMKLKGKPDGSFLVRDSSDPRYILSLSFRSQSITHHTRMEHYRGTFSLWCHPKFEDRCHSVVEFIERAIMHSKNGKFLYFLRSRVPGLPPTPVQLLYPVSRFSNVKSLQHLCRFHIRQLVRIDHIQDLPLPKPLIAYLKKFYYYDPEEEMYMSSKDVRQDTSVELETPSQT